MRSACRLSEITTEITQLESRLATLRSEQHSVKQHLEQVRDFAMMKQASVTEEGLCVRTKMLLDVIQEWASVYCLFPCCACVCVCFLSLSLVVSARAFYIGSRACTVSQIC